MSSTASIQSSREGVAAISGDLVFSTVRALSLQGQTLLTGDRPLSQIDLQGVTRVDSSGLALLLEWQSRAMANGLSLVIRNAPDDLARLAGLCEATGLLQLSTNETSKSTS